METKIHNVIPCVQKILCIAIRLDFSEDRFKCNKYRFRCKARKK